MTNRLSGGGFARLIGGLLLSLATTLAWADVLYVHTDHLNTPRLATNEQGTTVWRNLPTNEPFGNSPVEEDPDGDSTTTTLNPRFPGQYADKETNTHYNYFRDYDPSTGRYVQSDPIGLMGGVNTYSYVGNSPLHHTDELGLFVDETGAYTRQVVTTGSRVVPALGAFLGGVAVGTAIYNQWGTEIQDALEKMCPSEGKQRRDHRGRIQAQGVSGGAAVNVSSAWAQDNPLTKAEGFAHLHRVVIQIPSNALPRFTNAIGKAATFISNTSTIGPSVHNFYQNGELRRLRGADRIDIEVWSGLAF